LNEVAQGKLYVVKSEEFAKERNFKSALATNPHFRKHQWQFEGVADEGRATTDKETVKESWEQTAAAQRIGMPAVYAKNIRTCSHWLEVFIPPIECFLQIISLVIFFWACCDENGFTSVVTSACGILYRNQDAPQKGQNDHHQIGELCSHICGISIEFGCESWYWAMYMGIATLIQRCCVEPAKFRLAGFETLTRRSGELCKPAKRGCRELCCGLGDGLPFWWWLHEVGTCFNSCLVTERYQHSLRRSPCLWANCRSCWCGSCQCVCCESGQRFLHDVHNQSGEQVELKAERIRSILTGQRVRLFYKYFHSDGERPFLDGDGNVKEIVNINKLNAFNLDELKPSSSTQDKASESNSRLGEIIERNLDEESDILIEMFAVDQDERREIKDRFKFLKREDEMKKKEDVLRRHPFFEKRNILRKRLNQRCQDCKMRKFWKSCLCCKPDAQAVVRGAGTLGRDKLVKGFVSRLTESKKRLVEELQDNPTAQAQTALISAVNSKFKEIETLIQESAKLDKDSGDRDQDGRPRPRPSTSPLPSCCAIDKINWNKDNEAESNFMTSEIRFQPLRDIYESMFCYYGPMQLLLACFGPNTPSCFTWYVRSCCACLACRVGECRKENDEMILENMKELLDLKRKKFAPHMTSILLIHEI